MHRNGYDVKFPFAKIPAHLSALELDFLQVDYGKGSTPPKIAKMLAAGRA